MIDIGLFVYLFVSLLIPHMKAEISVLFMPTVPACGEYLAYMSTR